MLFARSNLREKTAEEDTRGPRKHTVTENLLC